MPPHSDPQVIFSVGNIKAFHLQNGQESDLTPSGPQTLSLLMVPTTSTTGPPTPTSTPQPAEEDFYLHLHLPPEIELPLPATTQVFHQPPRSYLIPRWDLGPDAGAFTRIEFPSIGNGSNQVSQDDVDTFETILAQCTAFLERSGPPKHEKGYNPATYGEAYGPGAEKSHDRPNGQIVLVNEENGSVVGELGEGFNVTEAADIRPGSKYPVAIQLPGEGEGNQVQISNVTPEYLEMASHPAYAKSSLVQSSATASRLLVTTSTSIGNALQAGADTFTKKVKSNPKPMTFTPAAHERVRKINSFTHTAADLSAKTVGQVTRYAQNIGASMAGKNERRERNGGISPDKKPGILNKSMIAISTLGDGLETGARSLLQSGSVAATTMVQHRYGNEAGSMAHSLTGGVRNVGLVYIDAAGVSRRAVIKSVAKGMVVGRMKDGQQLVVGGGDGGVASSGMGASRNGSNYGGKGNGNGNGGASSLGGPAQQGFDPTASSPYRPGLSAPPPVHPQRRSPSPAPPPPYGSNQGQFLGGSPMTDEKR